MQMALKGAFTQNVLVISGTGFCIHSKRKVVNLHEETEQSMLASTSGLNKNVERNANGSIFAPSISAPKSHRSIYDTIYAIQLI